MINYEKKGYVFDERMVTKTKTNYEDEKMEENLTNVTELKIEEKKSEKMKKRFLLKGKKAPSLFCFRLLKSSLSLSPSPKKAICCTQHKF